MGSILLLFVASSSLAIYQSVAQDRVLVQMMVKILPAERALASWRTNVHAGVQRATAIARSRDAELAQHFAQATQAATADSQRHMALIETLVTAPEDVALLRQANQYRDLYLQHRQEITRLKMAGEFEASQRVFVQSFEPAAQKYLDAVDALQQELREHFDKLSAYSKSNRTTSTWQLIAFTCAALLLGAVLAWLTSGAIVRPLRQAQDAASAIASLNLSEPAQPHYHRDETGQLLQSIDRMRSMLNHTMAQVLQASRSISQASAQVASGNTDLSARTAESAANLEQSASAIEELSSTAQQASQSTLQAETLSRSSLQATQLGFDKASHMQNTMHEIQQSSQKIGDIIGVIDGIAFQTNILALNAAVEAARAGEQGRGFAVVAGEVRTLAQRSVEAAKEIRELINSNLHSVTAGNAQVAEAGEAMRSILENVNRVQDIVAQVNAAAQEQSLGAAQVNQSIVQLDQMTQQNAALVQASTSAAAHLHEQAEQLRRTVEAFELAGAHMPTRLAPLHH